MEAAMTTARLPASPRSFPAWIFIGAVLIPLIYLPMLGCRFDFIDDGNLVYPTASMPLGERAELVWRKIVANYEHLGPFRPALWVHWELAADLLRGSEFGWRLTKLCWCGLATAMFLWLMIELNISPGAALLAVTLAMWNPYRSEIWTSLTLAEGIAMPWAIFSLVCAARAPRSQWSWLWDVGAMVSTLAAMGCKNTFVVLVPAQMFLRLAPDAVTIREGLRRFGLRAMALSLTIAAPILHFMYYKLHWHAGQYQVGGGDSAGQIVRIFRAQAGALGIDFVGVGLAACLLALYVGRARVGKAFLPGDTSLGRQECLPHVGAIGAGLLLLLGGMAVYVPIGSISPRYTMPAAWGLDLLVAVMLGSFLSLPTSIWKRAAYVCLGAGMVALAVANIGKQEKFIARAKLLWEVLETVQHEVPSNATIAWHGGDPLVGELDVHEGIHFAWHLQQRGRADLTIALIDEKGNPADKIELKPTAVPAMFGIWGKTPPKVEEWRSYRTFETTYRLGRQRFSATIARRP
jgi:hypothetical protein